jgi:predicted GIY-YIG superfamily endonuclease
LCLNIGMFTVYILRTNLNALYIGQTKNLEKRLEEHTSHSKKSARYLQEYTSFELVYLESYSTRIEAMHRELQLKKWSRKKKEALIAGNLSLLKKL